MTEAKTKRKSSAKWIVGWVVEQGSLRVSYNGPNRKKARETAQKILTDNPKLKVFAWRVSSIFVLTNEDMKLSLDKDAF